MEAREGFHIVSLETELSWLLQVTERTPVKIPEEVLKLVARTEPDQNSITYRKCCMVKGAHPLIILGAQFVAVLAIKGMQAQ